MKLTNAIKKLSKIGEVEYKNGCYMVWTGIESRRVIEVTKNGAEDEVATIRVRRDNDFDDSMTDYSAGSFFSNLSQALRFIEGR